MTGYKGFPANDQRDLVRLTAIVFVAALLIAAPSIRNGFVFDDVGVIQENETVHHLEFGRLVTSPYWPERLGGAMWRPVPLLAFAIQWAVGGGGPAAFHVTNVMLYGLVCGLVAWLAARLFTNRLGLIAGLLFAVHPVHVESTANVVGQVELWAALGYVGALLAAWYRMHAQTSRERSLLLTLVAICLVVALASKEHAVTFPGAVLLLWSLAWFRDKEPISRLARREWPVLVVSGILIVGYLIARAPIAYGVTATGGTAAGLDVVSPLSRAVVMLPVSLKWLELLFIPMRLSADYSLRHLVPDPVFGLRHGAALIIWILGFYGIWRARNAVPGLAFGAALFVVTISVAANIVVPIGVLLAERLLFLPSVGCALAVAALVVAADGRLGVGAPRRALWIGVTIVAAVFTLRSATRALVWYDKEVFFTQLLRDAPQSFRAHWVIGDMAFERGDSAAGEREMRTAVQLNPDHPHLLEEFGLRYETTGRYEPAIPLLTRAVEFDSTRLSSALPLARALGRTGRPTEALTVLDAMARIHGETKGIALVRGEMLLLSGAPEEALQVLTDLLQQDPAVWTVRGMVAEAAARAGYCNAALAQVDTALQLAPAEVHQGLLRVRDWVANGNAPCK